MAHSLQMPKLFSGLSRTTILLACASLFADISTEMLYPVLPIFLTQTLHVTGSIIGVVEGVAQAAQNIIQGFSGALSDKLQRRKGIAAAGYFLAAIGKPLMGAASTWTGVFSARLLDRMGSGIRSAPRDALIASSVAPDNRGKAFGLEGAADNAGAFLGPVLTAALLYSLLVDIRTIFYFALVPGLLAFVMVLLVREQSAAFSAKSKIDASIWRFPRRYWTYLLVIGLFCVGNSSNAFLILRSHDLGASLGSSLIIYAGFNLVAALASYPAGVLSDRFGRRNVLLIAFAVFALVYLGFAQASGVTTIAALFLFYGLYEGIFRAVGKAFAADFAPEHLRAGGIGWFSTTVGLLQLVASVVAGLLWDHVGPAAVFYYGAASATVGGFALYLLIPARPDPDGRPTPHARP